MSLSEKILDSIQILTSSAVSKASYDKTIQAEIISCQDETIGKYKCRYQDSYFYAYSSSAEMTFTKGTFVYVLIPGNDMSKTKTILGKADSLGLGYINVTADDEVYDVIGTNCVTSQDQYYLDTNNKNYRYALYTHGSQNNVIQIDEQSLSMYLHESSSIMLGAVFRTNIPTSRQYRGHYGITFYLRFLDNSSNQYVTRSYTIDEDTMRNDPYRLQYDTRQIQIFNVDGQNFDRLEAIEIFNRDFPGATGEVSQVLLEQGDIVIKEIEISGAQKIPNQDLSGISISFFTPQGTFFKADALPSQVKTITAQIKVKGKIVKSFETKPSFYWGKEDVGAINTAKGYNPYLGKGWKCLNTYNVVAEATQTQEEVVQWVPMDDTIYLSFNEATARNNKFKVVVVYNDILISKQIEIKNLVNTIPQLTIESSTKTTEFYYDVGHPTLTCFVDGVQQMGYSYAWGVEDQTGYFTPLQEDAAMDQLNADYHAAIDYLVDLRTAIANGIKFANAQADNLAAAQSAVEQFNYIQRVEDNKLHDVQIKNITNFNVFKCTVYNNNGVYLGTASIVLKNILEGQLGYSLVINNGTAVFKYDENGVAPNNGSLDIKQQIRALGITLYDPDGLPVDQDVIKNTNQCQVRWAVPVVNTLIVNQSQNGDISYQDDIYVYYDNIYNVIYNINQRYSVNKPNNQIKLVVKYKDVVLNAETAFTFTKDGEPGTNGSQYVVRLVPNTRMNQPPRFPMITKVNNGGYQLNYGINSLSSSTDISTDSSYQMLKVQLWRSGELVWQGIKASDLGPDGATTAQSVAWQVLANKYDYSHSDESAFEIVDANEGYIKYTGDYLKTNLSTPKANIIKCSVEFQDHVYYGTIPMTTAWVLTNNYRINLKENTGFRYVTYTAQGLLPQYDNSYPFEFVCEQRINGIWEDISNVLGNHRLDFIPGYCGNTIYGNSNHLSLLNSSYQRQGLQKNQFKYKPIESYTGGCVNNTITCYVEQNDMVVARIALPIHFLLNRFSFPNINDWDGNSVQINEDGGHILAPQMGAGSKDNNNAFTGVLMGQVKQPEKTDSQIGLFAFSSGKRSFFLDSQTGTGVFGTADKGRIVIDPTSEKAMLYSGNFWKNYNSKGLPSSYSSSNENGQGMLIDLVTPEIRWGNGNVHIDANGHFTFGNNREGKIDFHNGQLNISATSVTIGGVDAVTQDNYETTLSELINTFNGKIDGKIETWAKDTCPSDAWTTEDQKAQHENDLWLYTGIEDKAAGVLCNIAVHPQGVYQYYKSGNTYGWRVYSSDTNNLFDLMDQKTTIYYGTLSYAQSHYNPDDGDYLVDDTNNRTYRYNAATSQWISVINIGALVESLQTQIDGKIDTYVLSSDPRDQTEWSQTTTAAHDGDLWYYSGTQDIVFNEGLQTEYRVRPTRTYKYNSNNDTWILYSDDSLQNLYDFADGKSTVYYGDYPFNSIDANQNDIAIDDTDKEMYRFNGTLWIKITNYTNAIEDLQDTLQTQIDDKIETWAQVTDPSTAWLTTQEKSKHNGDLWYYTGTSTSGEIQPLKTYQYDATNDEWVLYEQSTTSLFNMITGKSTIYYGTYPFSSVTSPANQDMAVDATTHKLYRYVTNVGWEQVTGYTLNITSIASAFTGQTDNKIQTFSQNTDPSDSWSGTAASHNGDFWYYTGTSQITVDGVAIKPRQYYKYDGTAGKWTTADVNDTLAQMIHNQVTFYYQSGTVAISGAKEGDFLIDSSDGQYYRWYADNSQWMQMSRYNRLATKFMKFFPASGLLIGNMLGGEPATAANASGSNILLSDTALKIRRGSTVLAEYGDTVTIGNASYKNAYIDSNGLYLRSGTTELANFTPSSMTIGQITGSYKNVYVDTNGVHLRSGTTDLATFNTTGILFNTAYDLTIGSTTQTNPSYIRWKNNKIQICADSVLIGGNPIKDGEDGNKWYSGTALSHTSGAASGSTGISQANIGDMYLNTTYGYLYRCTTAGDTSTAKWTYQQTIKGSNGVGISDIVPYFCRSTSNSSAPSYSSFSTSNPTLTSYYKYLWRFDRIYYSDGTNSGGNSETRYVAGTYGDKGDQGDDTSSLYMEFNNYNTSYFKAGLAIFKTKQSNANYILINDSEMQVYNAGSKVASFGASVMIGDSYGNNSIQISSNEFSFYGKYNNQKTKLLSIEYGGIVCQSILIPKNSDTKATISQSGNITCQSIDCYGDIDADGDLDCDYLTCNNAWSRGNLYGQNLSCNNINVGSGHFQVLNSGKILAEGTTSDNDSIFQYSSNHNSMTRITVKNTVQQVGLWTHNNAGVYSITHGKWLINVSTSGVVTCSGSGSDRKYKDNISEFDFSKDLIMALKPITFMWKDGNHKRTHMGFIAQDVAEICKNLKQDLSFVSAIYNRYSQRVGDNYYGEETNDFYLNWELHYEELIPPLISLIQQHEKTIQQLKQQINEIKGEQNETY